MKKEREFISLFPFSLSKFMSYNVNATHRISSQLVKDKISWNSQHYKYDFFHSTVNIILCNVNTILSIVGMILSIVNMIFLFLKEI